jgi:uncharacterized protein YecE (DUF72 family)
MEFGQILDPEKLDQMQLDLPILDSPEEQAQASRIQQAAEKSSLPQKLYLGAPIWAHAPWIGSWYPAETTSTEMLSAYAKQFSTVEINSTFYSIPKAELIEQWAGRVPDGFRFCPKFPKSISHRMDANHPDLKLFAERIALLGPKLGVSFLQLPEWVGPDSKPQLSALFAAIPKSLRATVEFRHPGFFENRRLKSEWVELLAKNFLGTVIIDTPEQRSVSHASLTSLRVMIRFLGANLHATDSQRLKEWAERLKFWYDQGLKEIYFIVHEPDNSLAPEAAVHFAEAVHALWKAPVVNIPKSEQPALF